jgi:hypothetical protein
MEHECPIVNMYFDTVMPVIVVTCCKCYVELFRTMTYETKTLHKNYCMICAGSLEEKAWMYEGLDK